MTDPKEQQASRYATADPHTDKLIAEYARLNDALTYVVRIAATLMQRSNVIDNTIAAKVTVTAETADPQPTVLDDLTSLCLATASATDKCTAQIDANNTKIDDVAQSIQDMKHRVHAIRESLKDLHENSNATSHKHSKG